MPRRQIPFFCGLSAALLIAAFPGWNRPWAAWVGLVPWLIALQRLADPARKGRGGRSAFWWSYAVGIAFFLGSIWWLVHVTTVGLIVLAAYVSLYFGLFGWIAWRLFRSAARMTNPVAASLWLAAAVPSAWVAVEFVRAHALSGFGWNLLGYSQTAWLTAIQIADVTGVWGVSWLLVAVNVAVAQLVGGSPRARVPAGAIATAVLALGAMAYGTMQLAQEPAGKPVTVSVVQGNIPQEEKWDAEHQPVIIEQYARLTREAVAAPTKLVIWPETSVPGFLGLEDEVTVPVADLAALLPVPLLVGAPMMKPSTGRWALTNSAALFDGADGIVARYDKLHLVPFGEFIPGESRIPWLRDVLPPIGDFLPGEIATVFELPIRAPDTAARDATLTFGVLICFEDVFPELARALARRGAQMLVTITNDAWFGKTPAAYQHAQTSTLRAVELRRPMVRAANTGWSGCIDAAGRWVGSVRDAQGEELFVDGVAHCPVTPGQGLTVYARWGDWLPWACVALLIAWFGSRFMQRRSRG